MNGNSRYFLAVFCSFSYGYLASTIAYAGDAETQRMVRDALQQQATPLESANEFIAHSGSVRKCAEKSVLVHNGKIFARLLTPLNSSFNLSGDDVEAVVVSSLSDKGKPWLEPGSILHGSVEAAHKATYGQTDGALVIRFYRANFGDKQIDLFTSSDTDDGTIKPSSEKLLTKKQRIRGVLMTVSKIAIPAAIGTGGMSIAISAGAGAAIGLAFSDKGKRIQGTVRGAWEGAGLQVLDPLVCKGRTVILPQGTPIQLALTESVRVPVCVGAPVKEERASDSTETAVQMQMTRLETHAQVLNANAPSDAASTSGGVNSPLSGVNRKIAQNDLAAAITELTEAERLYPDDESVKAMHTKLYSLVSGGQLNSDTESGATHDKGTMVSN